MVHFLFICCQKDMRYVGLMSRREEGKVTGAAGAGSRVAVCARGRMGHGMRMDHRTAHTTRAIADRRRALIPVSSVLRCPTDLPDYMFKRDENKKIRARADG